MTFRISDTAALVLIDWQKSFRLDQAFWGPRNNPDAALRARALTAAWRATDRPVMIVKHNSVSSQSPLQLGMAGNDLEPFAEPQPEDGLYEKSVNSAFIGTSLEDDLRGQGIDQLIVSGATTSHCVSTSVRMAANLGFEVLLAHDACFTHAAKGLDGGMIAAQVMHETQLAALNGEFASAVKTDELIMAIEA